MTCLLMTLTGVVSVLECSSRVSLDDLRSDDSFEARKCPLKGLCIAVTSTILLCMCESWTARLLMTRILGTCLTKMIVTLWLMPLPAKLRTRCVVMPPSAIDITGSLLCRLNLVVVLRSRLLAVTMCPCSSMLWLLCAWHRCDLGGMCLVSVLVMSPLLLIV